MSDADGRMIFEKERKDLAKIVKVIFDRKLTNVMGGNLSFKAHDENGKEFIIMTPTMMSQAYFGELSASQILVIEPHTRKIVSGVGRLTREINMHEAIYDTNSEIKAILHAHAPNSMFWGTIGLPIPNVTEATQVLRGIPIMTFEPACSEELAEVTSSYIQEKKLSVPHMLLLDSHGILINAGGESGEEAIHWALALLDSVEFNAEIAYKQTVFQALGITNHFQSMGVPIASLDDLKSSKEIFNPAEIDPHAV